MANVDWDRRRKNVRILLAAKGSNPTRMSNAVGLSPNTVSKFTSGKTETLSEQSLSKVVSYRGLGSAADLDTDNPLTDPKVTLRRLIDDLPDDLAPGLLKELSARFADQLK
jgi:hypothetical protein